MIAAGKQWIDRHPVRAATFAGWVQQAITGLSAVLVIPILLKNLGADATGVWLSFQAFVMLAGLADFGVGLAVTRQAAHCLGSHSENASSCDFLWFGKGWNGIYSLWSYTAVIYRVLVAVAFLLGITAYELVVVHTKLIDEGAATSRLVWIFMLTVPCLLLFAGRAISLLNGAGWIFFTRVSTGLYFGVQAILLIGVVISTKSLLVMAITSAFVTLTYSISLTVFANKLVRQMTSDVNSFEWNRVLCVKFLRIAFPLGFVNLGAFLTTSIQVPLVGMILGPGSVAAFFLAQKLAQFSLQAALQFSAPKTISFSRLVGEQSFEIARESMLHTLRTGWVLILISQILFVFVLSPFAPLLLVGKEYPSFWVIFLIGLDYAVMGAASMVGQFVLAFGKNPFLWSTLASGVINMTLIAILVPRCGVLGIPVASLIAGIFTNYWVNPLWGFRIFRTLKLNRGSL